MFAGPLRLKLYADHATLMIERSHLKAAHEIYAEVRAHAWETLTEDLVETHGFRRVQPHEIGALTSNHTLLTRDFDEDDEGEITRCGRVLYYEPYQVRDPAYEMIRLKEIHLTYTD